MLSPHRKILDKDLPCPPLDDCDHHLPPLPPPPPSPSPNNLSPFLILTFASLAVALSFICYFILRKYSRFRARHRNPNHDNETHHEFLNELHEDHGPVIDHHIWLINTVGLDQTVIDSIEIFKYKRGESLVEGTDCSVCLSEFEDDDSLRLLPKCTHAFHVSCIDTWLRSHKNCPLCRAPIVNNSNPNSNDSTSHSQQYEITVEGSENVDRLRETESDEVETATQVNSNTQELQQVGRSVSMEGSVRKVVEKRAKGHTRSSSSVSRVTKTSSFGVSSRNMKRSNSTIGKCSQTGSC